VKCSVCSEVCRPLAKEFLSHELGLFEIKVPTSCLWIEVANTLFFRDAALLLRYELSSSLKIETVKDVHKKKVPETW